MRSNREILTGGERYTKKKGAKFGVDEVVFDKDSRKEFLTGFHKRKVERKKRAVKHAKEQERLERIAERKKMREQEEKEIAKRLGEINRIENVEDHEEWDGFAAQSESSDDEAPKGILQKKQTYKVEDTDILGDAVVGDETTVTVQEMENPYIAEITLRSLEAVAKANNVDLNRSDKILDESIKRAKNYAVICGVAKPEKKPKKKFRYLTKTERRDNARKQKLSKMKSRARN